MTDPFDKKAAEFTGKLAAAATSIRRDAEGKTCGECQYLQDSWCSHETNIDGDALAVLTRQAPACRAFVASGLTITTGAAR